MRSPPPCSTTAESWRRSSASRGRPRGSIRPRCALRSRPCSRGRPRSRRLSAGARAADKVDRSRVYVGRSPTRGGSMSAQIVKTAFDRPQRELGCEFMDWEGWYWPSHFGDAGAEHEAVRTDVGVWDASPLRKWDFRGRDALAAADRIFTNDMLSLDAGQVRYAPFCDEAGRMIGDGTVFKHADDYCTVVTALDSDLDHFHEVVAGLDAAVEPITENLPHVQLQGPRSRDVLAGLCDRDVHGLGYFRFWPDSAAVGGVPCRVSRTGYSGELGYEIFCEAKHAEDLWAVLTGAGARPYGLAAVETLRIESGLVF